MRTPSLDSPTDIVSNAKSFFLYWVFVFIVTVVFNYLAGRLEPVLPLCHLFLVPPSASWAGKTLREPQLEHVLYARCHSLLQHFYDSALYHLSRQNYGFLPLNSMNWRTNQRLLLYLRGFLVLFLAGSVSQYQKLCCQKVPHFKYKLGQELISCFQTQECVY